MKPLGMMTLAGLVLVVAAAPVTAFALTAGSSGATPLAAAATHSHPTTAPDDDPSDDPTGSDQAAEASAPGRAHAEAMKAWARCVVDAASGPKAEGAPIPPKLACGEKPMGPGRAKHAPDAGSVPVAPGKSGGHRHDSGHGH